ncbi:helix-turn-helix domain-containing protein [Mixta calida]|uniref:helix-turn-helix domain-containing protein n=1 Tax=Mixta calida TaxID=665913 RepID=UPI0034D52FB0
MSSKLHGLVWEGCATTGMILSRIAVMARLADYSNDEGISWPSVKTIAAQIGAKSENTVRTAIKQLAAAGWLTVQERRAGGRNQSNIYQLNVAKLEQVAAAARAARNPSKNDPSIIDPSKLEASKNEGSNFDTLNNDNHPLQNLQGAPSTVEGDPLIDPNTDPSITDLSSGNSDELPDIPPDEFLSHHPDAVVYTASGQRWGNQQDLDCARWLYKKICELYASRQVAPPAEPNWPAWANDVRLMRTVDQRTHRQICEMYRAVLRDRFWSSNILSPGKLREKWDELTLKLSATSTSSIDICLGTNGYKYDTSIPPGFRGEL